MKALTASLVIIWIIYQAVYSKFAPDYDVLWECFFYILLYGSFSLCLFSLDSKYIIVKLMIIYSGSYFLILAARYIYLLKFTGDYEAYYHSVSSGWLLYKLFTPLFLGGLLFAIQSWRTNR
jgi:hypothetical protein